MESCCLMGIEFLLEMMKNSEDRYWRWLYNNVHVVNSTEFVHLTMVKMINFMLYVFYYNKVMKNGIKLQVESISVRKQQCVQDSLGTNGSAKGSRMAEMGDMISEYSPNLCHKVNFSDELLEWQLSAARPAASDSPAPSNSQNRDLGISDKPPMLLLSTNTLR